MQIERVEEEKYYNEMNYLMINRIVYFYDPYFRKNTKYRQLESHTYQCFKCLIQQDLYFKREKVAHLIEYNIGEIELLLCSNHKNDIINFSNITID